MHCAQSTQDTTNISQESSNGKSALGLSIASFILSVVTLILFIIFMALCYNCRKENHNLREHL